MAIRLEKPVTIVSTPRRNYVNEKIDEINTRKRQCARTPVNETLKKRTEHLESWILAHATENGHTFPYRRYYSPHWCAPQLTKLN